MSGQSKEDKDFNKQGRQGKQSGSKGKFNAKDDTNRGQRRGGRSNDRRGKASSGEVFEAIANKGLANDISWHAKNPQLLADSCTFNYSEGVGDPVPFGYEPIPGVMNYRIHPIIGLSKNANSAVNIAAGHDYSWVRHANSGSTKYDPTDLMIYNLTMDSVYSLFVFAQRTYGVLGGYSVYNRYLPKLLIESMGWEYNDIRMHINDLRSWINQKAGEICSLCIPNTYDIFKRHMWLFTNVFTDSPDPKCQYYIFNPDGYYEYVWAGGDEHLPDSGGLRYHQMPREGMTFEDFTIILDDLIRRLRKIEDYGIMSGDIKKAYGDNGVWTLGIIDENYSVLPSYSLEAIAMIQNARTLPENSRIENDYVYVDDETLTDIIYNPRLVVHTDSSCKLTEKQLALTTWNVFGNHRSKIITLPISNPSPADNMLATRFNYFLLPQQWSEAEIAANPELAQTFLFDTAGVEFITEAEVLYYVYYRDSKTGEPRIIKTIHLNANSLIKDKDRSGITIQAMSQIERFAGHHEIWMYDNTESSNAIPAVTTSHIDVANFTFVDANELRKVNNYDLLCLYDVPNMGTFAGKR